MLKPAAVITDDESLAVAVAAIASAMADSSRVKMLCALMDGLVENMMTMAGKGALTLTTRTPVNLRRARTCYDHLAGELAVGIYHFLLREAWITPDGSAVTPAGEAHFSRLGIVLTGDSRRKACCACLDWSERRFHAGGSVGAAILRHGQQKGWFVLTPGFREVSVSEEGQRALARHFQLQL